MTLMLNEKCMIAAINAGCWLLKTQIIEPQDANNGRFLYCVNLKTGYYERSTGWQSGVAILALLKLAEANSHNAEEYLDSARAAAAYIISLQYLSPDKPECFGAFREETPQTQWFHPRDSVTCAWALARMYQVTGDDEYLIAAQRFAEWHLKNAWRNGWPVSTVLIKPNGLEHNPLDIIQGNFQAGSSVFFLLLSQICNDNEYAEKLARPLLDYYCEKFLADNGRPYVLINPTLLDIYSCDKPAEGIPQGWLEMHRYNDDFAALGLLRASEILGDEKYLQAAVRYIKWLETEQNVDGSFGNPIIAEAASSSIPLLLSEYQKITSDMQFEHMREKALTHLTTLQQVSPDNKINGAFLGLDNKCRSEADTWINIRNTSYAIMAFLAD